MPRPKLPIGTWGEIRTEKISTGYRARARFRDYDGVTRQVEKAGRTKGAARSALTAALIERSAPSGSELTGDTALQTVAELWAEEVRAADRTEATRRRYRETLENHIIPALGQLQLRECTVPRIDRFIKTITQQTGAPTAKLCRTVLSGLLGVAVRHGALDSNPIRDIAGITIAKPDPKAMTPQQVRQLRERVIEYQNTPCRGRPVAQDLLAIMDLLLGTGARIGELLALRWSEVNLETGTITLTGTISWTDTKPARIFRQDHPKTSTSRRTLTLPKFALDTLLALRVATTAGNTLDLVLPSTNGTPRDPKSVRDQMKRVLRPVDLQWVTPHTFRRTVATVIARASDLENAAAQLGHAGVGITAKHYVETNEIAPDLTAILDTITGPTPESRKTLDGIVAGEAEAA